MEEKDKTADLLKKIISKMQKKKEQESRIENNTIMVKPAKVIDSNGQNVNIYFLDDKNQTIYTLYNKTGETLNENDDVKVYYTSNPAKGWVGMKCGESLVETSSTGVGRPSEWDETSEYFNYYEDRDNIDVNSGICNVAGDPTKKNQKSYATASGLGCKATGEFSFAAGGFNKAIGTGSAALGMNNTANGDYAAVVGMSNESIGNCSFVCGNGVKITGNYSYGEGLSNKAKGYVIHIEGQNNDVSQDSDSVNSSYIHIEGFSNNADGDVVHIEGYSNNSKKNYYSHIEGWTNKLSNSSNTHIEGHGNTFSNSGYGHIEGWANTGILDHGGHCEGWGNHCEAGTAVHIEGYYNVVDKDNNYKSVRSHIGGNSNIVNQATDSFIEGAGNSVNNAYRSTIFGEYNTIQGASHATVFGQNNKNGIYNGVATAVFGSYNSPIKNLIFMVGNGTSDTNRSNAFAVDKDGNVFCKSISCSGSEDVTGSLRDTHIDFANTSFVDAFAWDETTYPNTTDPSLEGKPVLVIALTDGGEISYKFIDLSFLTTTSISQQTNNHIKYLSDGLFVNVNENIDISEQTKNLLEQKDDGLYVTLPISAESDNILEQKDDGYYVQKHQDNKKPIESYEYTSDTQITCNGITYSITKDESTGLISQVMDSEGNTLNPTINGNVTDVSFQNAVLMTMVMQNGLKSMN